MIRINIRSLSINRAWRGGARYRTKEYIQFEKDLFRLLPIYNEKMQKIKIPEGKLSLSLIFGVSNIGQDCDSGIKTFLDILQKAYQFNDNRIFKIKAEKVKTEKGKEFIDFEFSSFNA